MEEHRSLVETREDVSMEERLPQLDRDVATMAVRLKHMEVMLKEVRDLAETQAEAAVMHAACAARQEERWAGHNGVHRVAKATSNGQVKRLGKAEDQIVETRISIAKTIAFGGGGGGVVVFLWEIIRHLAGP